MRSITLHPSLAFKVCAIAQKKSLTIPQTLSFVHTPQGRQTEKGNLESRRKQE